MPEADDVVELGGHTLGSVIGVVAAAGGAGSTSLAAATACLGAERTSTALVDLDPLGVGVERVLGYSRDVITHWGTLGAGALHPQRFVAALPQQTGVRLVGFGGSVPLPIDPATLASVLSVCARAFGLTVLDIPRNPETLSQVARACDLIVVLCPQSLSAAWSGQRLVAALRSKADVALVTRVGSGNVKAEDIADSLRAPLLVQVSDQRGLDEVLAMGSGPLRSRGRGLSSAAVAILDRAGIGQ